MTEPAAPPCQPAEVGAFAPIGARLKGAAVAALDPTPNVGELGPPAHVLASLGGGVCDSRNPGGGVSTSLAAGWRVKPAAVTSSPAPALATEPVVFPAHVALGSFQTMAVLHAGHFVAPSGTVAPHFGQFMSGPWPISRADYSSIISEPQAQLHASRVGMTSGRNYRTEDAKEA
jgi:hypothetical protein